MAKVDLTTDVQVYYNSACPVCDLGVNAQKKRMQTCDVNWKDVHTDASYLDEVGSDLEFIRERLHVIDENQQLRIGVDAFISLWQHSPKEHWKAKLFKIPIIYALARYSYNCAAYGLYRWNRWQKNW